MDREAFRVLFLGALVAEAVLALVLAAMYAYALIQRIRESRRQRGQ